MRLNRLKLEGVAVLALLALGTSSACHAAEPQVSFMVKDGWVEFVLRQDGAPVPDAIVRAFDERGQQLAEGETGSEGQGVLPPTRGSSFTLEIKVGKRTADPIRLEKVDGGVEPANVLLSFGLRPCCRVSARPRSAQPAEPEPPAPAPRPFLLQAVAGTVLLLFGAAFLILARRMSRTKPILSPGEVS